MSYEEYCEEVEMDEYYENNEILCSEEITEQHELTEAELNLLKMLKSLAPLAVDIIASIIIEALSHKEFNTDIDIPKGKLKLKCKAEKENKNDSIITINMNKDIKRLAQPIL